MSVTSSHTRDEGAVIRAETSTRGPSANRVIP